MKKLIAMLLLFGALAACSPPVMFRVAVDEPSVGGTLTLNGASAELMHNVDGNYWAKWDGSDADGQIDVRFPDGGHVVCRIGYVTKGMQIQNYEIVHRQCEPI